METMPSKPPVIFPQEQRLLAQLGERIRLARLRRKLGNAVVAGRAGISRTSLYKVEAGDPGATMGSYLRVLAALGLESDLHGLAADDKVGRKLQDLARRRGRWVHAANKAQRVCPLLRALFTVVKRDERPSAAHGDLARLRLGPTMPGGQAGA